MLAMLDQEKRMNPRYGYPKTVVYTVEGQNRSGSFRAVVINISRTGISLYIYAAHRRGEKIIFEGSLPVEFRSATIKWIKEINAGFYKAGLEFIP